jgi:hypothetical protein
MLLAEKCSAVRCGAVRAREHILRLMQCEYAAIRLASKGLSALCCAVFQTAAVLLALVLRASVGGCVGS